MLKSLLIAVASVSFAAFFSLAAVTIADRAPRPARVVSQAADGQQLVAELGCVVCHAGVAATPDRVRSAAPHLGAAGRQYAPEYVFSFLLNPVRIRSDNGATRMPSFHLSDRESLALTLFLQTLEQSSPNTADPSDFTNFYEGKDRSERRALRRTFESARREHDDVTVEQGAVLFRAFNCAGCHEAGDVQPQVVGPDLATVSRLKGSWLQRYLSSPTAVRPFGFFPGSAARMPDFSLSEREANAIGTYLMAAARQRVDSSFVPERLSLYAQEKALSLVRDRLPCLGCHRLDGQGGRIGPDLSGVGLRLTPQSIRAMVTEPQRQVPGSIMPHHPMPDDRTALISSYLTTRVTATADGYLSPLDYPVVLPTAGTDGASLYARFCAACHGIDGNGHGFNASFLPVTPTVHSNSAYMAGRPDDTLYDGIHAGAYILGKSHRMPAFGQRLTSAEIRRIVSHMRTLCRCSAPSWSRDGRDRERG